MPNSVGKNLKTHRWAIQGGLNRSCLLREISFPFKFGVSCRPLQKLRLKMQRPLKKEDKLLHLRLVELQKLLLPQIVEYAILNRNSQHQLHR